MHILILYLTLKELTLQIKRLENAKEEKDGEDFN